MTFCIQWINTVSTFTEIKKIECLKIDNQNNKPWLCWYGLEQKMTNLPFSYKKSNCLSFFHKNVKCKSCSWSSWSTILNWVLPEVEDLTASSVFMKTWKNLPTKNWNSSTIWNAPVENASNLSCAEKQRKVNC